MLSFPVSGHGQLIGKIYGKETAKVAENTVLHVKFDAEIRDRTSKDPFSDFDYNTMQPKSSLGLNDILKSLEKASNDPKIKGIYLDLSTVKSGGRVFGRNKNCPFKV